MTEDEKRKEELHKELMNLQGWMMRLKQDIDVLVRALTTARNLHKTYTEEYEKLDRKIFMETKGITKVRIKKGGGKKQAETDISKMSVDERKTLLERLLKLQALQLRKRSGKISG